MLCFGFSLIVMFLSACGGAALGDERGRLGAGVLLGLLLGPLGILILLLLPRTFELEARHQLTLARRVDELRSELQRLESQQQDDRERLAAEQAQAEQERLAAAARDADEQRRVESEQRRAALLAEAGRRGDIEERDFRLWLAGEVTNSE